MIFRIAIHIFIGSCFTFLWINFRNSHSLLESQIGIKIKIHYLIHYSIFGIFKGRGNHKLIKKKTEKGSMIQGRGKLDYLWAPQEQTSNLSLFTRLTTFSSSLASQIFFETNPSKVFFYWFHCPAVYKCGIC